MMRCFKILLVALTLIVLNSSSVIANEMGVEDFINECRYLEKLLKSESPEGKINRNIQRRFLNKIDSFDTTHKIKDEKGNYYTFSWENEIELVKEKLQNKDDVKSLKESLEVLRERIASDMQFASQIKNVENKRNVQQVRNALESSLAKDESFSVAQPGEENKIKNVEKKESTMNLLKKILEYIDRIGKWIDERIGGEGVIPEVRGIRNLNWVIAVLIIIIVVYFFAGIYPVLEYRKKAKEQAGIAGETISISLSNALSIADREARSGNYLNALRELLKGFFMGLNEKGLIFYKTSRTNREYRRVIPRVAPQMGDLAHDFLPFMDDVLYGGIAADENNYRNYKSRIVEAFKET